MESEFDITEAFETALSEAKAEDAAITSEDCGGLIPKRSSEFRGADLCITKRDHESLIFNSEKGDRYDNAIAVKTIIHEMLHGNIDKNTAEAKDMIDQIIEDNSPTAKTDELRRKELSDNIMRYVKCERRKPLDGRFSGYVDKAEYRIRVKADEVFDDGNELEGVLYRAGNPSITQNGSKRDASVNTCTELHLLIEYLKQLVPEGETRTLKASYYFMKKHGDSTGQRNPDFFDAHGGNVVTLEDVYTNTPQCRNVKTDVSRKLDAMIDEYATGRECSGDECEKCPFNCACNFIKSPDKLEVKEKRKKEPVQYTEAQEAVINKKDGISRVIAGAGAGKTECVAERFKRLVLGMVGQGS